MSIQKDLEKLKDFLLDPNLDEEDYKENLAYIQGWEKDLRENESFKNWQESDVTAEICRKAKDTYRMLAMSLIANRDLNEAQRAKIYANMDAAEWIISLIEKDTKGAISEIHKQIKAGLANMASV